MELMCFFKWPELYNICDESFNVAKVFSFLSTFNHDGLLAIL